MTKEDILNCVPENMEAGSWLHGYTTAIEHSRNSEESFRREAAKDILCAILGRVERFYTGVSIDGKNKISDHEDFIKLAIADTDALIAKLKEEE